MYTQETIRHSVKYLEDAIFLMIKDRFLSQVAALHMLDPNIPCAAFGLARYMFFQCGSLNSAREYLASLIEEE